MMAAATGRGRLSGLAAPLAVLAAIATIAAIWGWFRPEPPRPVARYGLGFPEGQAPNGSVAISPDGSRLVYEGPSDDGQGQLWVKDRSQYTAVPLAGTLSPGAPVVSPDGQWIAFSQANQLKKIPIGGGAAITLADSSWGASPAWLDDGTLLYTRVGLALGRVSDAGGAVTIVWRPDSTGGGPFFLAPLPGARGAIFTLCVNLCRGSSLWVLDLTSGATRQLFPEARQGWYLPTGQIAYVRADGGMFAAPFDLKTLEVRSTPVPVLENLSLRSGIIPNLAFSTTGTLVMQAGAGGAQFGVHELVWVDRTGRETVVDSSWNFRLSFSNGNIGWALSPDGRRIAIGLNTNSGDDIWIKELPAGPLSRLTFDSTSEERPRWTPDGKSVTYIVDGASSLRQRAANGTGKEEVVLDTPGLNLLDGSWSKDGQWLAAPGRRQQRDQQAAQHPHLPPRSGQRPGGTALQLECRRVGPGAFAGREVAGLHLRRNRTERGVHPPLSQRRRRQVAGVNQRRAGPALGPQRPGALLRGRRAQHDGGGGTRRRSLPARCAHHALHAREWPVPQ